MITPPSDLVTLPGVTYTPFKGRTLDLDRRVHVYRNLHNGKWSLLYAPARHVVGHAETLLLERVTFRVDRVASARVASTGQRTVCAYAVGYVSAADPGLVEWEDLRYSIPARRFQVGDAGIAYAAFARFTTRPATAQVTGVFYAPDPGDRVPDRGT